MLDRNFILSLIAAISLVIGYNIYYEVRFGEYLKQQQIQATLEAQKGEKEVKDQPVAANQSVGEKSDTADLARTEPGLVESAVSEKADQAAASRATTPIAAAPVSEGAGREVSESAQGRVIKISTGVTDVYISTKGAAPVRYDLVKYHDAKGSYINLVFNEEKFRDELAKKKEDLTSIPDIYPTLGLSFPKKAYAKIVNGSIFDTSAQSNEISLQEGDKPVSIRFELRDGTGVVIRKTYTFRPNDYSFDFEISVNSTPKWGEFDYSLVWFGLGDEESKFSSYYSYNGSLFMVDGRRVADAPDDENPVQEYKGEIKWAALSHRYFTVFCIPEKPENQEMVSRYINDSTATLEWKLKAAMADKPVMMHFFLGPKKHELLDVYENGIKSIINYGWFDIIAKPMFWVLNMFHKWTGNWGWSIILLTIVTKVLFFPLTQKGFKSMQKLQKLQPHMKRIQEAYKDDKEKLNQEMLVLYREHKVNPLGGCLPLILQIPIFFSLYKVLLESIELKGASWILWIKDLSMADPYYVTPVLMGFSMLGQQLMTPKTGDPMQRRMMMMLPVVFTIMFLSFPTGLVIYWLVNNILTIGQQWIIYRDAK